MVARGRVVVNQCDVDFPTHRWYTYLITIQQPWGLRPMDDSVFVKVREIIIDQLGVTADAVVPDARFREDLKADSLDLVELIMRFEEEFGGEISDKEAEGITTVGDAVTYLRDHQTA